MNVPKFIEDTARDAASKLPAHFRETALVALLSNFPPGVCESESVMEHGGNNYRIRGRWVRREHHYYGPDSPATNKPKIYWLCSAEVIAYVSRKSVLEP